MPFLVFWRLRSHCAVSQNVQNAISWPLQSARSLDGGSKCHIGAFRDFAVIARSLRGVSECSKCHFFAFGDWAVVEQSLRSDSKSHIGGVED